MSIPEFVRLCKSAGRSFIDSNPSRQAAALAFYSVCSFAPLSILAIIMVGWYSRDPESLHELRAPLVELVGPQNATTLEGLIRLVGTSVWSARVTVFGAGSLMFGASGVFAEVQSALNTIWSAPVEAVYWRSYIRQRFWTFVMLLVSGFILVSSLLVFTLLTILATWFTTRFTLPYGWLHLLHSSVSFLLLGLLFTFIYTVLPDVQMHWRDVVLGAVVTSVLFSAGKALMGWYLGRYGVASVYGPVSALVAVPFWLYYSSHIFLFGAHFTHVYTRQYGSLAPPKGSNLPPSQPRPKKRRRR